MIKDLVCMIVVTFLKDFFLNVNDAGRVLKKKDTDFS